MAQIDFSSKLSSFSHTFPYFPIFSHVFPYFFSGYVGDIPYISPFDKPKTLDLARWRLGERSSGIANTF